MIDKLNQSINKLSCSEAKNALLNMMYRIRDIKELSDLPEEKLAELYSLYDEITGTSASREYDERQYEAVHIVCGESVAGSLRVGLGYEHKVIGFPDFFAVGPLWKLDKDVGRKRRYDWLESQLTVDMNYIEEEYKSRFSKTVKKIDAIPNNIPIVIWSGDNADEQTGIRYILNLLKEKPNDISLISATTAYQELFNTSDVQYFCHHTAHVEPEKLNLIYEKKLSKPLSFEARNQFQREWKSLSETEEVLRVWENNQVKSVNENHFDQLIIACAQKVYTEEIEKDYMRAALLIGEVLGELEGGMSDTFLEYRIRRLIHKGVFDMKGNLKSMRHYSVKLK